METQLANVSAKICELHKKRKLIDDEIAHAEKFQKKLSGTLCSPIFQCCAIYFVADVAMLIFDYLNLAYCHKHNTHFPKIIYRCLGCLQTPHFSVPCFICPIGPLHTTEIPLESLKIVNFHEENADLKHHIKSLIDAKYIICGLGPSTEQLESEDLDLYLRNENNLKQLVIEKRTGISYLETKVYDAVFDLQ